MTYQTPTPVPTPCANTMRDGLREVYVSLKTPMRAHAVGVKCLRSVRCVLKLIRAHLLLTSQVEPTRCLREKLPSRLSTSGYTRLRACSSVPTRGLICPLSFCPFATAKQTLLKCGPIVACILQLLNIELIPSTILPCQARGEVPRR